MEAEGGGFSGRMAAVLGALGGDSGLAAGWRVSAEEAVFKDGGDSADGAGSEDEDEELMAERGGGEGGGEGEDDALGEEDGDVEFRKSASVAFCSGLDRRAAPRPPASCLIPNTYFLLSTSPLGCERGGERGRGGGELHI